MGMHATSPAPHAAQGPGLRWRLCLVLGGQTGGMVGAEGMGDGSDIEIGGECRLGAVKRTVLEGMCWSCGWSRGDVVQARGWGPGPEYLSPSLPMKKGQYLAARLGLELIGLLELKLILHQRAAP